MHREVMIVDDDSGIRSTASLVLRDCKVTQAGNGADCLAILRAGGFRGVILMDVMMPELDGWQTIRAIVDEGLNRDILICMLTAVADPGSMGAAAEEVVFDYLPKPFNATSLRSMVENAFTCLEA